MELLLGVTTHKAASHTDKRYDVHEADTLEHDENRDALRQRYQRAYWESIPETGSVRVQVMFFSLPSDVDLPLGTDRPCITRTRYREGPTIRT